MEPCKRPRRNTKRIRTNIDDYQITIVQEQGKDKQLVLRTLITTPDGVSRWHEIHIGAAVEFSSKNDIQERGDFFTQSFVAGTKVEVRAQGFKREFVFSALYGSIYPKHNVKPERFNDAVSQYAPI